MLFFFRAHVGFIGKVARTPRTHSGGWWFWFMSSVGLPSMVHFVCVQQQRKFFLGMGRQERENQGAAIPTPHFDDCGACLFELIDALSTSSGAVPRTIFTCAIATPALDLTPVPVSHSAHFAIYGHGWKVDNTPKF